MTTTESRRIEKKPLSWTIATLIFTNVGFIILVAVSLSVFGSLAGALAYLKGDRLILDSYKKSFGNIDSDHDYHLTFSIMNKSKRPVKILGAHSSCNCLIIKDLPVTIGPSMSYPLGVKTRARLREGNLREKISLFTDFEGQPEIKVEVSGKIMAQGAYAR